jgi:GT2 family glycosyltransferase/glycosyltransferase involved in cell wall biosynthesis
MGGGMPIDSTKPRDREASREDTTDSPDSSEAVSELKELYASLYRVGLQAFLTSSATLDFQKSPNPVVSVILVLFNRAELTLACLRSLLENTSDNIEVIIVDNASSDLTPRLLDRIRGARIIRNSENRNFLLAVNQAAREASGRYLLLLNNDAQLLPGSLRAAVQTLQSGPDIGAVGGRIILFDGSLQEAGSILWRDGSCLGYGRGDNPFASAYMFRRDVDYCSGAFLLTPRSVWQQLGGFDEAFVPAYYEETDYCARLWENGLRVVYEPAASLLHYEFASSKPTRATELQARHQEVFARRHAVLLQRRPAASLDEVLVARMSDAPGKPAQPRILFIDDRAPHPWLGSGFPRARTIVLALRKRGYFVTLFPMAVLEEDWATLYSDLPREIEVMNEMGPQLLEAFVRHRRGYYDVVIISRPHNMNYLKPILDEHPDWFKDTSIIYDAEALFAPRDVALRQMRGEQLSEAEIEQIYQDEIGLTSVADAVIAVSELDRAEFRNHGVAQVHLLGHCLEPVPTLTPFDRRRGFLFVGAIHEEASPNGDSMIWFLSEIWPQIQARLGSDIPLTIAGINCSDKVSSLAGPSVRITGYLDDITSLYESARVFVAPTRYAAGIPHKVHEASARGLPVVATPLLARQLNWSDGKEIRVAEDAAAFAEKCVELHEQPELWTRTRDAALAAIRRECATDAFESTLYELVAQQLQSNQKRYADAGMDR